MSDNYLQKTEFLLFQSQDGEGDARIQVAVKDETIWLTQKGMAELFGVGIPAVAKHLENIYQDAELQRDATISILEMVRQEGSRSVSRKVMFYNLDAIISVGYRVNSRRATQFRIWATGVLKEYMRKGFALDDDRLKQGRAVFGKDYFRELLERVRSIRASERRIWQQITDIFAECAIDYDRGSEEASDFYAMVQNKFHYAITGQTAAEIIISRADHTKEHMGLETWKHAPDGRILKSDVTVAKNYLPEKEIKRLERAVTGFFDYIEDLIERENTFTMEQFASSVDEFLHFRRYQILPDKGKVKKADAERYAKGEYDIFNRTQPIESDFDREVKKLVKSQEEE